MITYLLPLALYDHLTSSVYIIGWISRKLSPTIEWIFDWDGGLSNLQLTWTVAQLKILKTIYDNLMSFGDIFTNPRKWVCCWKAFECFMVPIGPHVMPCDQTQTRTNRVAGLCHRTRSAFTRPETAVRVCLCVQLSSWGGPHSLTHEATPSTPTPAANVSPKVLEWERTGY